MLPCVKGRNTFALFAPGSSGVEKPRVRQRSMIYSHFWQKGGSMEVKVIRITGLLEMDIACGYTVGHPVDVRNRYRLYKSEHSPVRSQIFRIETENIKTFASVHMVRHKIGVEHFVRSNREDRGGDAKANRDTPIEHLMHANAQALITMGRKRLCFQASDETRLWMEEIKRKVSDVDPDLGRAMVPDCEYRGGFCWEFSNCGLAPRHKDWSQT